MKKKCHYHLWKAPMLFVCLGFVAMNAMSKPNKFISINKVNLLNQEVKKDTISEEMIKTFSGSYTLRHGEKTLPFKVFIENNELKAQAAGQKAGTLIYEKENIFHFKEDENIKLEFTVQNGLATEVILHQNGMKFPGTRN